MSKMRKRNILTCLHRGWRLSMWLPSNSRWDVPKERRICCTNGPNWRSLHTILWRMGLWRDSQFIMIKSVSVLKNPTKGHGSCASFHLWGQKKKLLCCPEVEFLNILVEKFVWKIFFFGGGGWGWSLTLWILAYVKRQYLLDKLFLTYNFLYLKEIDLLCISHNSSQVTSVDMALALGVRSCNVESRQFQWSRENWVCLKFSWTRNSLLVVSYKLVWNSRSWSQLWWFNMVWIGYSSLVVAAVPD